MYKRLILFVAAITMIIIGTSLAQEIGTGEVFEERGSVFSGQDMTEVDTGSITSSGLEFTGTDNPSLSEEIDPDFGSGTFTGESDSGIILEIIPDPQPHLILSEVYYDGTDEWIEITNIGDGVFSGNLSLVGVKSTLLSLANIYLLPGESKIFGDTLSQVSGNRFVGKTGLSLNLIDTAPIMIQLSVSGQVEDEFLVDAYWVNQYNDKKISFEKVGSIPTRTSSGRVANVLSGYTANPGVTTAGGNTLIDVSYPPTQSGDSLQLPIPCVSLDPRGLLKIVEIFPGNETYPPYIELAVHDAITLDSLSISGNLLGTGMTFSRGNLGTTLEKGSFLLVSSSGYRNAEGFQSVRNGDFSLVSTGNWLVITIGYRQSRRVMDIAYHSGEILGSSIYFEGTTSQCAQVLDSVDYFSPGFERRFLKYLSGMTMTKIEYLPANTGDQGSGNSCPSISTGGTFSGENQVITTGFVPGNYIIQILNVVYDPEGSDTDNEKLTLLAHHISGDITPLDLSKTFRLNVNGTNKTLPWTLLMDRPTTFKKTFGFPNSTKDGNEVMVKLTYGSHVFSTYTYNPNLSKVEELMTGEMESTGVVLDLSELQFSITYVLPNPTGKDINEEIGILMTGTTSLTGIDLSQGFTLRRENTKKKLSGFVIEGQENILSGNLGLINKAACISLFYQETELTRFCYRMPKEGEKIYASDSGLASLAPQDLSIMTSLQLKKIDNSLCIRYDGQSYLCKKIPAGKAALKTTQEQKLYKGFSSMIKSYLMQDWKPLYYDTDIKHYFDLLAESKKLIGKGYARVDIYGQRVPVTDIKKQFETIERTSLVIVALFEGVKALLQE